MNLFRGNTETILEILQTQRDSTFANPVVANVTHAAEVTNVTADVAATIETPVETLTPTTLNHHLVRHAMNRLVATYPCGMPLNFAAQFANGGDFIPYQALVAPNFVGNVVFLWDVPTIQTPPTVDAANPEDNQGQVLAKTPDNEDEDEYRGPRLHFQIPSQAAQPANMNQFQAAPFLYPRETSVPMLTYSPNNPGLQYV